jgi:hypothetical protein
VFPELVRWRNLDDRTEELLRELMHLVDSLSAHAFAVPVLAFEPQETELGLVRQVCNVHARLHQILPRVDDGSGERPDVARGSVDRLLCLLWHVGRSLRYLIDML